MLLLLLLPNLCRAENWKDKSNSNITAKIGLSNHQLEMHLEDKNLIGKKVTFVPNAPGGVFLDLSYSWLGGAVTAAIPSTTEADIQKGQTKAQDWQFRFNFRQWVVESFYQQYTGYYVENTKDFQAQPDGTPFLQFPDLANEKAGLTISYMTRPESFSMAASFDNSVQQVESGWTLIYSGSLNRNRFSTPTSLIPASATGTYGDFEKVRAASLYSALIGAGLAGTWVMYGHLFVTGVVIINTGIENQSIERTDINTANTIQTNESHLKLGLGYNGDDAIVGAGLHVDATNYNIENARVSFNTLGLSIYFGTRFKF